jgi:hypothetical protein
MEYAGNRTKCPETKHHWVQNILSQNILGTKRPETKCTEVQNIPGDKTSGDKLPFIEIFNVHIKTIERNC